MPIDDFQMNLDNDSETNNWFNELQYGRELLDKTEACCFYAYQFNSEGQTSPRRRAVEQVLGESHAIFPGSYLREPLLGGAVPFLRGYHHDSIYVGKDRVVEVLGDRKINDRLGINDILDWAPSWEGGIFNSELSFGINQVISGENAGVVLRANEHVGWMWQYHVTLNNCQHFASWCLDEEFFSDQGSNPLKKEERCSEMVALPYVGTIPRWKKSI